MRVILKYQNQDTKSLFNVPSSIPPVRICVKFVETKEKQIDLVQTFVGHNQAAVSSRI